MTDTEKTYTVKVKKLPHSEVEFTVSVAAATFDAARDEAIEHLGNEIELPGFRKGKAPAKLIAERAGEAAVLEEMAEHVIMRVYAQIIVDEKLDVLGRPKVNLTKVAM